MIIKKLEMYNFRQYIGPQEVEFSTDPHKNVTVLIGVNTSGKTTIVRAFEWCLYGKNGFDDKVLLNSEVRSNMNVGDIQQAWVAVTFIHDSKTYTIKRIHQYTCTERKDSNVFFSKKPEEKLTLEYLQNDGQTKIAIDYSNIKESMDRVLPSDLSDYFFFGGERISSIANRTDLTSAVRGLMRLDVLENSRDHLSKVLKGFESKIDTTGDANAQKARDALETAQIKLKDYEDEKDNADKQMQYWQQKENEYNAELSKSNIEQVKAAKANRDNIERAIASEKKNLANSIRAMVDAFNNRTYAFFGMPAIKDSLELLEYVKDCTESVPSMEQDSIDYLIKRGICICGTQLSPGSIPYTKVMEERKKLPPENIGSVVKNYKNKAEGYLSGSESFVETLEEKYKQIRGIRRTLGQLQDDYEAQADLILDDTDAKAIEIKRRDAHSKFIESKNDFEQATKNVGSCNETIKNCKAAIEKYASSSKKNEKIARVIAYSKAVYDWLNDTYVQKEITVRTELEKRVNHNFSRMYHGERSIVIDDKYRVRYSDVKTEESDGLKAVKSFAFIASLVSMAKDKVLDEQDIHLGQEYPIVMDAPFSNVDEIHINNICEILPLIANQVIMAVMKKDWDYATVNLSKYVGMSYQIQKDTDAEGREIDTSTHIA